MTDSARITVTLLEPVAAGKRLRTDFMQDTYDHLPGTVLRGALASRHLNESEQPPDVLCTSDEFLQTFEGDGSFGPLHNENSLPLPLSVKQHKYAPGYRCPTVWEDQLPDGTEHCPTCRQELEFSKGEPAGTVHRVRRTRAELDEDGVARHGQLFTQNSLQSGTRLRGWLHGPALRALHIGDEPVDTLYFGGRTKHQGAARVQVDTTAEPEPVPQCENRLFLRLLGPGVFVDQYGFPSLYPDLEELSEQLRVNALHVEKENSRTRWCEVEGWHAASGLPKPVERAVQPGSTYVIRCDREADPQARKQLMARGIGLRRREGFGALYSGQQLLAPREIANTVAGMRNAADQATYLPLLHERAKRMRSEPVDDRPFRDRLAVGDKYADGLTKLLNIVDPTLFGEVLKSLESSS